MFDAVVLPRRMTWWHKFAVSGWLCCNVGRISNDRTRSFFSTVKWTDWCLLCF